MAQISLAVALVIGAALMAKGMESMLHIADAFRPDKALRFDVSLPAKRYDTPQKRAQWYSASLDKLRALPGVTHAEITISLPHSDDVWTQDVEVENRPVMPGKMQNAQHIVTSEGYLAAMHIPIVDGRAFSKSDSLDSVPVAIVSGHFAQQYFAGENPLGHRIHLGRHDNHDPWLTIVGVAEETSYALWVETHPAVVYMSAAQLPLDTTTYAVTTEGNPLALAVPARRALAAIDPALPLDGVMTWAQRACTKT